MARSAKPKDRPSLALELALAKLGTSGLDAADFAALKLKVWEGPETAGIDGSFPAVPSLEFPYLDPFNKWAPLAPKPKWPPVRRFRLLQEKRKTIGMRVPSNPIAQALLETLGEPMLSTSLMLPGSDFTESDPEEIKDRLEKVVDLIIHGGFLGQQPTTVIDLTEDTPVVLREGVGDVRPFL